jgi:hypothetical protein
MNGVLDWGDFTPNNNKGNSDRLNFLWLKSGNTYRVRPVAKPVIFYKYFYRNDGKLRTAICEDPASCMVKTAHPELDTPGERFAILVIDRADGELKIMEFTKGVFLSIKAWWNATQQSPGGNDGVDWAIQITGSGKNGTKYTATPTTPTPFTSEEKSMIIGIIKDADGNDAHYLEGIFKPHSAEVIEKKLFGEWETRGDQGGTQTSQAPVDAQPAPVDAQPAPAAAQPAPAAPAATQTSGNFDIDF